MLGRPDEVGEQLTGLMELRPQPRMGQLTRLIGAVVTPVGVEGGTATTALTG